jgi:hypothetical protein
MTLRFRRNGSTATTSQQAATRPYLRKAQIPNHGTDDAGEHAIYALGPVIGPPNRSRPGAQYSYGRFWVAPDLLLTSPTPKDTRQPTRHARPRDPNGTERNRQPESWHTGAADMARSRG